MWKWIFSLVAAVGVFGYDLPSQEHKVTIAKTSTGVNYCFSHNERAFSEVSIQLAMRFNQENLPLQDQVMASYVQRELIQAVKKRLSYTPRVAVFTHPYKKTGAVTIFRADVIKLGGGLVKEAVREFRRAIIDVYNINRLNQTPPPYVINIPEKLTRENMLAFCKKVTPGDVQAFMKKYYKPKHATVFIVGGGLRLTPEEDIAPFFDYPKDGEEMMHHRAHSESWMGRKLDRDKAPMAAECSTRSAKGGPDKGLRHLEEFDESLFHTLPIADADRAVITKIIHYMGKNSVFKLLMKKSSLERDGDKIEHLHPLRFLWHIFTSNQLRADVKIIERSYFKWNGFMDGCRRRLDYMSKTNNLEKYLPGFVKEVNIDHKKALSLVRKKDWENFVRLMIK